MVDDPVGPNENTTRGARGTEQAERNRTTVLEAWNQSVRACIRMPTFEKDTQIPQLREDR